MILKNFSEINKGIFTTCKKNDDCPPWTLQAKKITHDKLKKSIIYDNALLKLYDLPVFYFPKFFHPDPTVKKNRHSDQDTAFNFPRAQLILSDHLIKELYGAVMTRKYFLKFSFNRVLTLT